MNDSSGNKPSSPAFHEPRRDFDFAGKTSLLHGIRHWLRHTLTNRHESLKAALEEIIEDHEDEHDRLEPEEKAILRNVLEFGDISVSEVMVPRMDILAVPQDVCLDNLKKHIFEQRHTRIPVYEGTLDKVSGLIHTKDLMPMLSGDQVYDIAVLIRPMLFVPPSMRIIDLLVKMRHSGTHMAIVIDEYGGTDGLVTMEDLFEEIVGDIQDEHDDDDGEHELVKISSGIYEATARLPIEELEKSLGLTFDTQAKEGEFETLGGLIFFEAGRVPLQGEIFEHQAGVKFEILEADTRRINRVRIMLNRG